MREQSDRKWKLADIGKCIRNILSAILHGELLMRLNIGKYFIHIIFTFILLTGVIWASLGIESTMTKVEENKKILKDLSVERTKKSYDLMSLSRRSTVERMLREMGSDVQEPSKRETVLDK